jgi:hypothetical protein
MLAATVLIMTLAAPLDVPALIAQVDSARLRATVEKLASFTTRNTLSPMLRDSAEWLAGEYRKIPGVNAEIMTYTIPKGRRVPEDKPVVQVVAWVDPSANPARSLAELKDCRVVLVGGHLDSLNLQVEPETGRAPGANDDASGVALALESARLLAGQKLKTVAVFVGFTGEEQGLHGSRALAKFAKAQGWKLEAVLSHDTVGSSSNKVGAKDEHRVRVFSDLADTHNSRELARYVEWAVRTHVKNFGVKLVFRADRFGRGGDHTPFAQEGFSAVRFIEVHEEYTRQHTPDDLPEFMDWAYLANVTRANVAVMAELTKSDPAPTNVRIVRDQNHDTSLSWTGSPGTSYRVFWRLTTSPTWQGSKDVISVEKFTIEGVNKDDHEFAVGSVGGIPVGAR